MNQLDILRQNFFVPIDDYFMANLTKNKSVLIVSGMDMINYLQNIKYKFQEGMFVNSVEVKSYVELVHGTYQVPPSKLEYRVQTKQREHRDQRDRAAD